MTKEEEKKVLAMLRLVQEQTLATEKTSLATCRERTRKLQNYFRELGFNSSSATRFIEKFSEDHVPHW